MSFELKLFVDRFVAQRASRLITTIVVSICLINTTKTCGCAWMLDRWQKTRL